MHVSLDSLKTSKFKLLEVVLFMQKLNLKSLLSVDLTKGIIIHGDTSLVITVFLGQQ